MEAARKNFEKPNLLDPKASKKSKRQMISEFKREKETYDKARKLKEYIEDIRAAYTKNFTNEDCEKRQMAVATYLVDKLCLRAGNDKDDDDEIDTAEVYKLKVENVKTIPPNSLEINHLINDSLRCENTVHVELSVYKAIEDFLAGKNGSDAVFDKLEHTSKLNAHLEELMPGLTGKVFRAYNTCISLDEILNKETPTGDVSEKLIVYRQAIKEELPIICNFYRTTLLPETAHMYWLKRNLSELQGTLTELKADLDRAVMGSPPLRNARGKRKPNLPLEELERKIAETIQMIEKLEQDIRSQVPRKRTSVKGPKTKYIDPRIKIAWCKKNEVPVNRVFTEYYLPMFEWAMDVDMNFRF